MGHTIRMEICVQTRPPTCLLPLKVAKRYKQEAQRLVLAPRALLVLMWPVLSSLLPFVSLLVSSSLYLLVHFDRFMSASLFILTINSHFFILNAYQAFLGSKILKCVYNMAKFLFYHKSKFYLYLHTHTHTHTHRVN